MLVSLVLLGGCFIAWQLSLPTQLEVRERISEKLLLAVPIQRGERFVLSYRHSLDGTEVFEEYRVEDRGFTFLGYTGSRAAIEYRGYTGSNERVDFHQPVTEIPLNPEPTGQQTLHVGDRIYVLWRFDNKAPVRILVRHGWLK